MASQAPSTRTLDIENGRNRTENRFNPMPDPPQGAPDLIRPLFFLIILA
jgi:hypothetical protein